MDSLCPKCSHGSSDILVYTTGSGNAGSLSIKAGNLNVTNSNIVAASSSSGDAGSIDIELTKDMRLSGKSNKEKLKGFSTISSATIKGATGQGGNVQISAEQVTLENASSISAKAEGTQDAGTITINASNAISNSNYSEIITEADHSSGGDIFIKTPNLIITEHGSVKADVKRDDGAGGNITVDVNTLALNQGGQISSNSGGSGQGGNISITASQYVNIVGSGISSTTKQGVAGNISHY